MFTLEQFRGADRLAYTVKPGERLGRWQSEGRGFQVDHAMTAKEALALAHSDWTVSKRRKFTERRETDANGRKAILLDSIALVRDCDETVLGEASNAYAVAQNLETLESFLGEGALVTVCAGIEGGKVYAQCELGEYAVHAPGGEDRVSSRMTFLLGHDGRTNARVGMSATRAVCENTMTHSTLDAQHRFRHTSGIHAKIDATADLFRKATDAMSAENARYDALARVSVSEETMRKLLLEMWPSETSKVTARRGNALRLFAGDAQGARMAGATAWGAYNAITEVLRDAQGETPLDSWLWNELSAKASDERAHALQLVSVLA